MKLYHGSNLKINSPDFKKSKRFLDFGVGFYLTSNEEQAISFAHKVIKRVSKINSREVGAATVSEYEFDLVAAERTLRVKHFLETDEDWLDFVIANRAGKASAAYDVVIGPVANDDIFEVVGKYEDGLITKAQAIKDFKVKKLYNQFTICSEAALRLLKFVSYKQYSEGK